MGIIRSKSMSSQKRASFGRRPGKTTMREQATTPRRREPPSPRRRARNKTTTESATGSEIERIRNNPTDISQRSIRRGGTLRFKLSRSRTAMSSGSFMSRRSKTANRLGGAAGRSSIDNLGTSGNLTPQSPAATRPKKKGNLLVPEEIDKETNVEEVIFMFDSTEECHNWLSAIILEIENQAKLFTSCINLLEDKEKDDNYEIILRKAVDLMTVAKGVRSRDVWDLREQLARLLEAKDRKDDAKFWYNLSVENREAVSILELIEHAQLKKKAAVQSAPRISDTRSIQRESFKLEEGRRSKRANSRNGRRTVHSYGSMISIRFDDKESRRIIPPSTKAIAIENIATFLEQVGRSDQIVLKAKDEAIRLVDENSYVEISKKFEAEYGKVPEGFEFYLIVSGRTPLEKVRDLSEALKMQDRNRRRQL